MSRLRHKYHFEKRMDVEDGAGNTVSDWERMFTTRANRSYYRGVEKLKDNRQRVILVVRKSERTSAVTDAWRVIDARSGETNNVRAVEPVTGDRFVHIIVENAVNDG